ncbi:MAG: NTP transferase domain-containing protein, partial [Acidobacteriota bacterium]
MTKVAGLIPARFSSNRLPGKVLLPILGKPMIQRVYERVLQAKVLDVILVGTDDERVAEAVRGFGGRVVLTSPEHPSGTDRLAEMVQQPDSGVADADIVVNIQADQPFMDPRMIEEATRPLLDDPDLPMAT